MKTLLVTGGAGSIFGKQGGLGLNVRDWLFVDDHCAAIERMLEQGRAGESCNNGGNNEQTNLSLVRQIFAMVDRLRPGLLHALCESLIRYVADRPGHDRRYAIDASKIEYELARSPTQESGNRSNDLWL